MYVLFFRPYNEKMAIMFLAMFIGMVVIHCILKGAKQCGKN